jgi:hypothetical protein
MVQSSKDRFKDEKGDQKFDATKFSSFVSMCDVLVKEVAKSWEMDLDDLSTLIGSYMRQGWEACRDKILQNENEELRNFLLTNPNKAKLGKAAGLLQSWRKLVKSAVVEGLTPLFPMEKQTAWQSLERSASDCFTFTMGLMMVAQELPNIRNKFQRRNAAKKYEASLKDTKFLGENLTTKLHEMAEGRDIQLEDAAAQAPPAIPDADEENDMGGATPPNPES